MNFAQVPIFIITRILILLSRLLRLIILPIIYLITWLSGDYFHKLDERHRIKEDWYIIPYFLKSVFSYFFTVRRHRFQTWYIFIKQVELNGDRLAIRYAKPLAKKGEYELESFTYKETYDIVLRMSHILTYKYNVKSGDYVALDCTNKPLFLFLWLSCWNIGAIPAFLNYNSVGKPLVHSLKISDITQVFIDPDASEPIMKSEEEIKNELPNVRLNYLDENDLMSVILNPSSPTFLQEDELRSPKDLTDFKAAMLIYTSGTTGLPKSAIMSWRKAAIGCQLFGYVLHMNNESVVFTGMPLFHSTAALLGVCAVLSQGGCIAVANKFSATNFWKQAYLTEATHIQYVGEVCRYLLHTPVSKYESIHRVKVAYGNGLRPDIWQAFRERFNIEVIGEFYAATEAPFATTSFQKGTFGVGACRNYGTIIQWFLSFQQTLVKMDPNDDTVVYRNKKGFCEVAPIGEPGEMLMRIFFPRKPETSFQGYLGNEMETKSKVLRNVFRNGDAWYRCGDLLKADKYGLWYFIDRMGDTFRWKSENVSTTEVEDQISAANPEKISQVVVVGIKVPKYEGRAGFAVIKLHADVDQISDQEKINILNKTLAGLQESLPKYALPLFVKFVNEILMTDNHKVLKKLYREQELPSGSDSKETLFWLSGYREYKLLTKEDWYGIENQTIKL
ncbi:long-chain fatty acid transporter FAT1 NDAI_0A06370 [Naumovozyma dairenensis CBS 421]|uniref:Very long-chain fatty acid transport protein n=1 Tax=Naumovozyma dairenensis (strain ATCC 10597 / BCRC 20456 / CBS 421 / NBRC 0211 / NRRL Y-12639) TaxID=1071378 RepID=G0W4Q3_NAUDC|nr:hypothetical protein NDAI_0A06370 [Naumovozyma dairenensis CBS 421]CCD22791.1 hypothetical protein NDAI_0A06370 [Naumovozyma dairenensis CBS 421]